MRSKEQLKSAKFKNIRLENVKTILGTVKLKSAKLEKSFLEANKTKHLQLYLPYSHDNQVKILRQ